MRSIAKIVMLAVILTLLAPVVSSENVYVDRNPAIYEMLPSEAYGWLEVRIRGVTVQDPYVLVVRDNVSTNLSYLPDHSENVYNQNPGALVINVLADGVSKPERLATGKYQASLRQGNADQPEQQEFVVGEGLTRVVFLGAAYASGDEGCCSCHNVTIVDAAGSIIHHQEINHTILHPAGTEVVVIVDTPAWTETIFHPAVVRQECHPAVNFTQKQMWYYTHSKGWKITTPWRPGTCPLFETIFPRYCEEMIVVVSEAYCQYIVEQDEYPETVHHPEVNHTETRPIGEPWYEIVVDAPAWDEHVGAVSHEERVCGQKQVCPCGCVRGERE